MHSQEFRGTWTSRQGHAGALPPLKPVAGDCRRRRPQAMETLPVRHPGSKPQLNRGARAGPHPDAPGSPAPSGYSMNRQRRRLPGRRLRDHRDFARARRPGERRRHCSTYSRSTLSRRPGRRSPSRCLLFDVARLTAVTASARSSSAGSQELTPLFKMTHLVPPTSCRRGQPDIRTR